MVTVKDVARLAGVSMITVSRVVNNSDLVGEDTRQRVEAAIEELHYVPNMVASNLRSQRSDFLALVLPDITNSFWTSIARGAEDEAWSQGYGMFICNTDSEPEKEDGYIQRLLQRRVEGVLIVPTPGASGEKQLRRLQRHGIKFVVIHRKLVDIAADVVRTDGQSAARDMTAELARSGRTRIAFLGLPFRDPHSRDRLVGYQDALRDAGLPLEPALVRIGEDRKGSDAERMVADLLDNETPPDAILLANSRIAIGGLRAIERTGLHIPDDIAVAAFHDINLMDVYAPRLIRAVQPSYRMGQAATRRLLEIGTVPDESCKEIILETDVHLPGIVPDHAAPLRRRSGEESEFREHDPPAP